MATANRDSHKKYISVSRGNVYIFRKTIRREKEEFRITETSEFLTNEKRSSQEKNIKINKDNRNTRVRKEILILR